MPQITTEQLAELLANVRGAQMVSIVAKTIPTMRKTDNPHWGNCFKLAHVNGVIGWKYENSVNNQRIREEQPTDESGAVLHFTAEPRTWGERLHNPLVEKDGQFYLELKVQKSVQHQYQNNQGETIPHNEVQPFLRTRGESKRQQVDKPVILRDYKLSNIKAINMEGTTYEVLTNQ